MTPLEKYAQVILHSGCAIPSVNEIESRLHRWDECRSKAFYLGMARKHQYKLKSNGIVIGTWISEKDFKTIIMNDANCPDDGEHHTEEWAQKLWSILNAPVSE